MSQTDYDIVDQTGLSFLADLNTTLAAIVSNNSGATEPADTFAYMWWADTTSGLLKQRNAADTGWVDVLTLAGIKGSDIANVPAGDITSTDQQAVNNELDTRSFGIGQTWQDMLASRALSTTYTNTTGKPIVVSVVNETSAGNANQNLFIDSILIARTYSRTASSFITDSATGIVPDGSTYSVDCSLSTGIFTWAELR